MWANWIKLDLVFITPAFTLIISCLILGNYAFGSAAKDYRRRKRQMERDITRSMFSIRVTEMKAAWLQNK